MLSEPGINVVIFYCICIFFFFVRTKITNRTELSVNIPLENLTESNLVNLFPCCKPGWKYQLSPAWISTLVWVCWSFQQGSTGSRTLDLEKWLLIRSGFFVESGLKNLCLEEFETAVTFFHHHLSQCDCFRGLLCSSWRWTSLPQKTAAFNEGGNSCIGEGYPLTLAWHGSDTDTQSGSSFLSVFRLRSRLAPSPWFMGGWTFTPWLSLTVGPGHSSWPLCNEWTC